MWNHMFLVWLFIQKQSTCLVQLSRQGEHPMGCAALWGKIRKYQIENIDRGRDDLKDKTRGERLNHTNKIYVSDANGTFRLFGDIYCHRRIRSALIKSFQENGTSEKYIRILHRDVFTINLFSSSLFYRSTSSPALFVFIAFIAYLFPKYLAQQ